MPAVSRPAGTSAPATLRSTSESDEALASAGAGVPNGGATVGWTATP